MESNLSVNDIRYHILDKNYGRVLIVGPGYGGFFNAPRLSFCWQDEACSQLKVRKC